MNGGNPITPQIPSHSYPYRSWSDDTVSPKLQSRNSIAHGVRSASFSASQAPRPSDWNNRPPPPPVPQLPPSLVPGYRSPPLTHSNRDLFFTDASRFSPGTFQPRTAMSSPGPGPSHGFISPTPGLQPAPSPSWCSADPYPTPSLRMPAVSPRPPHSNNYAGNADPLAARRLTSYGFPQVQMDKDLTFSPPPALPPRPSTMYEDLQFRTPPSPEKVPKLPPKIITSPIPAAPVPQPSSSSSLSPPSSHHSPSLTSHPPQYIKAPETSAHHGRTTSADDMSRALALSLAESQANQRYEDKMLEEEDQELARALAESLSDSRRTEVSRSQADRPAQMHDGDQASSRSPISEPADETISVDEAARYEAEAEAQTRRHQQEKEDEKMTRKLLEEETKKMEIERAEREKMDGEMAAREAAVEERKRREEKEAQERKDEEFARILAATGEAVPKAMDPPASPPAPRLANNVSPGLPQYSDAVSPSSKPKKITRPHTSHGSAHSAPLPHTSPTSPSPSRTASTLPSSTPSLGERPEFLRNSTAQPSETAPPKKALALNNSSHSAAPTLSLNSAQVSPSASRPPMILQSSVEPDLLRGVSFGFDPPPTQLSVAQLAELPPCPSFPEVIKLYPAPSRPFHIVAPSWRHLMRLLAQLETRVEPSLEAIASSKAENHLRVVVQFVRPPYSANAWRTIIHLSLDHVVPANTPQTYRFTNGDTHVLPYSYTLGQDFTYLAMSPTSQYYTIPLSSTSPFPILPIALPNLALYLQSAMRDSRVKKVQNDPSNSMRRLARLLSTCYPEEMIVAEEDRESGRGMGGLFKRVVGRGRKKDTPNNEEVADLVTPFRIDQYAVS